MSPLKLIVDILRDIMLYVIMQIVFLLNVVMLIVFMLRGFMLNFVMLSVEVSFVSGFVNTFFIAYLVSQSSSQTNLLDHHRGSIL
jgi:hypothetical protein